jgi:DNA-dependent RNA polymerase auxiliary subunit epsilon
VNPKPVPGFENLYLDQNGIAYQNNGDGFEALPISESSTYQRISVAQNGKRERYHIHVLMAVTFLGLDLNKHGVHSNSLQVDHIDQNKRNNCVSNLEVVTKRENYERALNAGCYSKNGYASKGKARKTLRKFSKSDVETIKKLKSDGLSYRKIAEQFNCTHIAIYQILKGNTYQDLS